MSTELGALPVWIGAANVHRTRGGNWCVQITPAIPEGSKNRVPVIRRYVPGKGREAVHAFNFATHYARERAVLWSDGERLIVACRRLRAERPESSLSVLAAELRLRFGGDYIHRAAEAQGVVRDFLTAHGIEVRLYSPADNFASLA